MSLSYTRKYAYVYIMKHISSVRTVLSLLSKDPVLGGGTNDPAG